MCGIAGIVYPRRKQMNKLFFDILGIQNDSRGGDSCGVFVDGKVEYGFGKTALYKEFSKSSELLKNTQKCEVALLHCRKASVGGVTLDKAQPNIIKEGDDIKFVVLHNGTIHNYKELAKKYIPDVDITNMSDSQVFTRIFYEKGYDVLGEYNGGAVFFIADYRSEKPRFFAWKGRSRKYYYNQSDIDDERPFYYSSRNGALYFSSIPDYLQCVDDQKDYWTIKPNMLCEWTDGEWYKVIEFDRSNCTQSSYVPSTTSNNYGYGGAASTKSNANNTTSKQTQEIDMEEYYRQRYSGYGCYGYGYEEEYADDDYMDYGYREMCDDLTLKDFAKNEKDDLPFSNNTPALKYVPKGNSENIIYDPTSDLYYFGGNLCHGMYAFDEKGVCKSSRQIGEFYFWKGVILYNYECFEFLDNFIKGYGIEDTELILQYPNLVHYLSPYPFKVNHEMNDKIVICDNPFTHGPFNGCITKLTEAYTKTYSNGDLVGTKFVEYSVAKDNWSKVCNIDFDALTDTFFN